MTAPAARPHRAPPVLSGGRGGRGGRGGNEKKPLLWKAKVFLFLSGRLDSNQRPPTPEAGALTGLRYTPNKALIVSRAHKDNPKIRNGKINFRKNRPDCGSGRRSDASCCGRRCAQPSAGPSRIPLHGLPECLCAAFPDASARFSRIPPHDLPGYLRMASFLFPLPLPLPIPPPPSSSFYLRHFRPAAPENPYVRTYRQNRGTSGQQYLRNRNTSGNSRNIFVVSLCNSYS